MTTTLTPLDLAGAIALLLWGVHMVQTGIQPAFGAGLRRADQVGRPVTSLLRGQEATA